MAVCAQDRVFLPQGDSVAVTIPATPLKETRLPARAVGNMNDYGFKSVVVMYSPDSVRIHRAGEISGYFRQKPGDYLGAGYFFSKKINVRDLGYRRDESRTVFLQRVHTHKNTTIWFYREDLDRAMPECYFLIETAGQPYMDLVRNYAEWKKWAVAHPPFGRLTYLQGKPGGGKKSIGNLFVHMQQVMEAYKKAAP